MNAIEHLARSTRTALVHALLALAAALPAAASAQSPIRIENDAVEPLPGRDYSMRVDVAAARFERYDASSGRTESTDLAAACVQALAPGLWLAVPQRGSASVALLPLGANGAADARIGERCADAVLALPPAVVERIHADGGVVYVDAGERGVQVAAARNGAR